MRIPTLLTVLILFAGVARAEDWDLNSPPRSVRAKKLRQRGIKLWKEAKPTCELVFAQLDKDPKAKPSKEPKDPQVEVDAETLLKTVATLEEAALWLERSVQNRWNSKANDALCTVVRAWFRLRQHLPAPPPPADEKAKKKADAKVAKVRRERLRVARKFVMEYGAARRYTEQMKRCPQCEGRKVLRSPFGDSAPCKTCRKQGELIHREGVIHARWKFHSPFYRADSRRRSEVNRTLRLATRDAKRLAPFVHSVAIRGKPEYHDTWVRIRTTEKVILKPHGKRPEKIEARYDLYRVGKVWFFYHLRYDKDLLEIPPDPETLEPEDEDE